MAERISSFTRAGLTFDVRDAGPGDGTPVMLLHGFPQDSRSWERLAPLLHARGFRTFAVDQRGYSPGARPRSRWAYRLSALSAPHPAAFVRALLTSSQFRKSWYMAAFQLPVLPERVFATTGFARRALLSSGMTAAQADRDLAAMRERSRIRGALNWYRAMPFTNPKSAAAAVTVPTLYVWSDDDIALGPVAARLTERFVTGPYTFETLHGVSHWIPEEAPEQVDALLGAHLR